MKTYITITFLLLCLWGKGQHGDNLVPKSLPIKVKPGTITMSGTIKVDTSFRIIHTIDTPIIRVWDDWPKFSWYYYSDNKIIQEQNNLLQERDLIINQQKLLIDSLKFEANRYKFLYEFMILQSFEEQHDTQDYQIDIEPIKPKYQ